MNHCHILSRALFRASFPRALALLVLLHAVEGSAQVQPKFDSSQIPVRLGLETSSKRAVAGDKLEVTVMLKNLREEVVSAPGDVPVTVKFGDMGSKLVVIPMGQSTVKVKFVPSRSGVFTIESTSPKLSPASSLLLVKLPARLTAASSTAGVAREARPTREELSTLKATGTREGRDSAKTTTTSEELATADGAPAPTATGARSGAVYSSGTVGELRFPTNGGSMPVMEAPLGAGIARGGEEISPVKKLEISIEPNPVPALQGKWVASITLALLTASGALAEADHDLVVRLSSDVGTLSKKHVVIRAGADSTLGQEISLTSDTPGRGLVRARSQLEPASMEVLYNVSGPAKLHLEANPKDQISDGMTPIEITVMLLDSDGNVAATEDRDVKIVLTPSIGSIQPPEVIIAKGDFGGRARLTSTRPGLVTISVHAVRLASTQTTAEFLLPWRMVAVAAFGGLLGGIVFALFRHKSLSLRQLWPNLIIGVVVGAAFYGLALFGVASLSKTGVDIDASKLPTYNAIAALLLGFLGGLFVRMVWEEVAKKFA